MSCSYSRRLFVCAFISFTAFFWDVFQPSRRTISARYVMFQQPSFLYVLLGDRAWRLLTPCSLKRVVAPEVALTGGHKFVRSSSARAVSFHNAFATCIAHYRNCSSSQKLSGARSEPTRWACVHRGDLAFRPTALGMCMNICYMCLISAKQYRRDSRSILPDWSELLFAASHTVCVTAVGTWRHARATQLITRKSCHHAWAGKTLWKDVYKTTRDIEKKKKMDTS